MARGPLCTTPHPFVKLYSCGVFCSVPSPLEQSCFSGESRASHHGDRVSHRGSLVQLPCSEDAPRTCSQWDDASAPCSSCLGRAPPQERSPQGLQAALCVVSRIPLASLEMNGLSAGSRAQSHLCPSSGSRDLPTLQGPASCLA